jgi:tripeptidyl-peptidase-2
VLQSSLSSSSSSILLLSFQGEKASSKDAKDVDKNHDQSQSDSGVQRDLFEENFKELQRWVDVNSSKYGTLLVLRERRSGRLGTALKVFSSFLFIYCV